MSAHTPGPWELRQSSRDYWFIDHKQGGEGYTLTKLEDWTSEADARLIAAAPDLLDALRDLVAVTEQTYDNRHELAAALDAIERATGGAA